MSLSRSEGAYASGVLAERDAVLHDLRRAFHEAQVDEHISAEFCFGIEAAINVVNARKDVDA